MKHLIALVLAAAALADTPPDAVGLHLASWHSIPGYDNSNHGGYLRLNGWQAGAFQNSYGNQSAYLGHARDWPVGPVRAGFMVGAATGYTWTVSPVALATVSAGPVRLAWTPKIGSKIAHAAMVHLMLEWELK